MSIINEALKKTQTKLESTKTILRPNTPKPLKKEGQSEEKNVWLWIAIGVISAGFISCATVFIMLISANNRPLTNVVVSATGSKVQKPIVTMATTKQSLPKKKPVNGLVLNGIITTGQDHTALINDSIYKVGDDIDGMKIMQITTDKVEVSDKGKTFTLTTK